MDELMNLATLEATLQDLARDVETGYKEELERNGHYTTLRTLINSVHTYVKAGDRCYEIRMQLEDYWKYLETGTRPHWPPPGPIAQWIEVKPTIPKPSGGLERARFIRSLEYLIRRKIAREGTKGTHDLEKTKDAVITAYRDRIEAAIRHDLYDYILKVLQ